MCGQRLSTALLELDLAPLPYGATDPGAEEGSLEALVAAQAEANVQVHPKGLWAQATANQTIDPLNRPSTQSQINQTTDDE